MIVQLGGVGSEAEGYVIVGSLELSRVQPVVEVVMPFFRGLNAKVHVMDYIISMYRDVHKTGAIEKQTFKSYKILLTDADDTQK